MKQKNNLIYSWIVIVLAVVLTACSGGGKSKEIPEVKTDGQKHITLNDEQFRNAGITLGTVARSNMATVMKLSGRIDVPPQNMVSISAPLGGYLRDTKLLPGQHLNKGEVIATMEDQQYIQLQQDFLTAKANFGYMESEYMRQKDLNESKASSDKVFEQAKAAYLTQKVNISALGEKLKLIGINPSSLNENNISRSVKIYSPINGFVSKVNINIGKYANPSDILFELVDPSDIHLNIMVFEKDVDKLYAGQKVTAFTNGNPEKKYAGEIILVGRNVSGDRHVEVHCHFDQYDKTLIPGMYMNAEVQVKTNDAAIVPEDAVVHYEGKDYVFTESGKQEYEMTEVRIGQKNNGMAELLDAEAMTGKKFVVKGTYALLMMAKNIKQE
jgi:cobalt-zinc-cadmium efflux system membrane fusion protein